MLLLHPIVRVFTCECAANIVEKYECSLAVGPLVCTCKQCTFFQQECHFLNIKEHTAFTQRICACQFSLRGLCDLNILL